MLTRRAFLRNTSASAGVLMFSKYAGLAAAQTSHSPESRIEVLLNEPIGTISPNIYGHFTENLGGVIYDGLWVGKNSKVRNTDGIRQAVIDHMRKIKAPVVRYPGGCFADSYDWRDGIGPADKRPRRTNFWANVENPKSDIRHKYDPNQFGTDEFIEFCKLTGSQPYLAANVRGLPAIAFQHWVEYCNSPAGSTTYADIRAAAGHNDPYSVRFWGVGNESWGCGGEFTPEEYGEQFRRYTTWVPSFGQELSFIASGPNVDDWNWTRGFLEEIVKKGRSGLRRIYGMALHHYAWNLSRGPERWENKADALKFDAADWYELLREGERMEGLIDGHWQVMGEIDHEHRIKLIVDEWGPWYKEGSEATPGDIVEQMPTLRDAVFSGMTLDIFNRNPDKVAMANCAQLINCLNSLYLAHEDKFVVTPVGQVFELYTPHQGGQALRTMFSSPQVNYDRDGKPATFWGLKGAASLTGKNLFLTVVNPDVTAARETEIVLRGASVKSGKITTLTHSDIHAHNTFEQPNVLTPQTKEFSGGVVAFPAASVNALQVELI